MKIRHIIALVFCALLPICESPVSAQEVNAGLAEFTPEAFDGYPRKGTFLASFGKTSGTIPAGTAQVIFTMVPEVPWNGDQITIPAGWARASNSTPTNIRFILTEDWTNASEQNPVWIVPVTSQLARSDQSLAVTSQIQQLDGDWTIVAPLTRISITVANVALPVTLTSFTATKEDKSALLKWTTTEETNSDRFDIEQSFNGVNWNVIGSVKSGGESTALRHYSFVDPEPANGENLYRLKMVDKDRTFAYSRIQSLTFEGIPNQNIVFPNPASGRIELGIKDLGNLKSVRIYDLRGKAIYTASGKGISRTIDVRGLSSGAYVVEIVEKSGKAKAVKIAIVQ
ncbi:T9SS type A sorting domain-containing protein [Dyadobacter sp. CY261]|uniref:T9SS type A sorting domain-containing protein n=1 Tax=Dyadobacter sp. CY261 TaxID=2907203 RepID=UPI001F312712|nr:T9SS type A sorting domain-containing protein [Dyadobacter sp. CY261]MCF0074113.1 T9SS type A sorting domain-containing protein [Dyadobacter sp. CY261]